MSKEKLILEKTHDRCKAEEPRLTVVFIHGIAADSSSFAGVLEYLENKKSMQEVRFVTFDLLGAGKSYKSDKLKYDYDEQLEALHNAIAGLKLKTPLILAGHSMGTFITVRYANKHPRSVKKLVLISPPVYTEQDLENPAMKVAMQAFKDAVSIKNRQILKDKAFNDSIENIVLNKENYQNLTKLSTPAVMVYGLADRFVASHNYPKLLEENTKYIQVNRTEGGHGVTKEKYNKIAQAIEEVLNAEAV